MRDELKKYIDENLVVDKQKGFGFFSKIKNIFCEEEEIDANNKHDDILKIYDWAKEDNSNNNFSKQKKMFYCDEEDINTFVRQKDEYSDFQSLLFKLIDERNLKDSDVYNKVHIDRRLFSKIRSNNDYHPSKETIILLGLSLELNIDDFINLLDSASYSLPKNNYYDLIIRFCFINGIYKITEVNELLSEYNCNLFDY